MNPRRLLFIAENIHKLSRADRIVGFFLYDKHKEVIARIDGVLAEAETYLPRYIVITVGGFLDIRGKRIMIPRPAYEVVDLGEVRTAWSRQSLQDAPSPNDLDRVTPAEEERILSYFDLEPYWIEKPGEDPAAF